MGDIDTTFWNVVLTDSVTEKNVAIRNGLDYWVLTHGMGTNDFHAYYIDENGINTTSVISSIGVTPGIGGGAMVHADAIGILKPSPSTYKLSSTTTHMHTVELFDFDPCTGVLSNVITLSDITNQFIDYPLGVEFSENEQYLYVASALGNIHQFDISSGNQASIIASHTIVGFATSVSQNVNCGEMVRRKNGKIYIAKDSEQYLSVIESPNIGGLGCNFIDQGVYLGGWPKECNSGLPNMISPLSIIANGFCGGEYYNDTTFFSLNDYSNFTFFQWDFGDPSSSNNTSISPSPSHLYSAVGIYNVSLVFGNNCVQDTLYTIIEVVDGVNSFSLGIDTCTNGANITLNAPLGYDYLWNTGDTNQQITISATGQYSVEVSNICSTITDSIYVSMGGITVNLGNDTIVSDTTFLILSNVSAFTYLWNTGDTTTNLIVDSTGTYTITVTDSLGCSDTDDIFIRLDGLPNGIHEKGLEVLIYPNPTNNQMNIKSPINGLLELYNILGERIISTNKTTQIQTLDMKHLSQGVYLLKLEGEVFMVVKE